MAGTTAIGGYPVPDNGDNINNIGGSVAASIAAIEKALLNVFATASARDTKITSANAAVGMYSAIKSPAVHLERLLSINNDGTLTWAPSDIVLVGSKAQQSAVNPVQGVQVYRTDTNVLSLADQAGGTFWPLGHAGVPTKYELSGAGSAIVDGGTPSNSPNYFTLSTYNFTVTPSRDGWALLSTVSFGGTAAARTDGGSAAGWGNAKLQFKRDGVLLSPFGSFADVILTEGGVNYLGWMCPQRVLLREGSATTFTVGVQIANNAGAFRMADHRFVLFQD